MQEVGKAVQFYYSLLTLLSLVRCFSFDYIKNTTQTFKNALKCNEQKRTILT